MTVDSLSHRVPSSVFLSAVTYDEDAASVWRRWLSEEEQACVASFGAQSREREFVAGRAAARKLLAEQLDTTPARVPLRRAEDDAVDVDGADWHISIAHSGLHAIAACARHPIGTDLEHIEPRDPAIERFLFASEDRGLVESLPYDSDASLVLCWALKEAVLKARRTGFRTSPKDLHLVVQPEEETALVGGEGEEGRWRVHYAMLQTFWGTVALPSSPGSRLEKQDPE